MRRPITRSEVVVAVAAAMLCAASAARADLTVILDSPDRHDEPNLIGVNPFPDNPNPSILETLYGEGNLRRVDDAYDIAFRHTGDSATVKAVAHFTSAPRVRFGYLPNRAEPEVTVLTLSTPLGGYDPVTEGSGVIDLADSGEVFELSVLNLARTSNPIKNGERRDQLVTFEIVGNDGHPDNPVGSLILAWEDNYSPRSDRDFQDFVFEISGVTTFVPESTSPVLLLAGIGVAWLHRRRKPCRVRMSQ